MKDGTAKLWAYLLLVVHPGSQRGEDLRLNKLRDPDAIYGEGFRLARHRCKQARGFGDCLRRVRAAGTAAA